MPNQYIYGNQGTDVQLNGNEQVFVAETGSIATGQGGFGILALNSGNTVSIFGTVFSDLSVTVGGQTLDHDNYLFIGETGHVFGSAGKSAVTMSGFDATLENSGTIWNRNTDGVGILLSTSYNNSLTKVVNSGTIDVEDIGIEIIGQEAIQIENSGLIKAHFALHSNSSNSNSIAFHNSGQIVGVVNLSNSSDIFDTRLGTLSGRAKGFSGNDTLLGSKDNNLFNGGKGNDKLYGYNGNDSLYGGEGNDTLVGGNGNDSLYGDVGNDLLYGEASNDRLFGDFGKDTISGGAGKDFVSGGQGVDKLIGGADADSFYFEALDTGTTMATADTILDFEKIDRIDFTGLDANTKLPKYQSFNFIGTQAFHGKAGELRFDKLASDTYIYGDTNGDKKADLVIHLDDPVAMMAKYFVL